MGIGIQPGYTAATLGSSRLDTRIRQAKREILKEPEFAPLGGVYKLSKNEIPGEAGGCQPDGGLFTLNGRAVAAVEGKSQRKDGNAIDRQGKNRSILDWHVPGLAYVMLVTGPGAEVGGPIYNAGCQAMTMEFGFVDWNVYHRCSQSWFVVDPKITVAQIKAILRPILRDIIENEQLIIVKSQQLVENDAERRRIRASAQMLLDAAD